MISKKSNKRRGIALTSAAIVLALLFTGFGAPGFLIPLIKKDDPEPVIITPDSLLSSIETENEQEQEIVLPQGNSQPFSINPQPGVTISAEENALDHDRTFTLTPCTEEQFTHFNEAIQQIEPDERVLYAWDLDAGLAENEVLPGTFHVDLDLEELGIFEENYPYLSVYRVSDTGVWNEYAITIENGHLSFDSNKNCPITLSTAVSIFVWGVFMPSLAAGFEYFGTGVYLGGFDKMYVYENDVSNDGDVKNLGKKLYRVRVKFSQTVEIEMKKLNPLRAEILTNDVQKEIRKTVNAEYKKKYNDVPDPQNSKEMAIFNQMYIQEENRILCSDSRYTDALANVDKTVKQNENGKPLDFTFYKKFGNYCRIANKYLKEQAKVKVPDEKEVGWYDFVTNQVIDVYLDYNYTQGGVTQFDLLGNYYVVVKGEPIMTGSDTTGQTLATLIHELLHVSQREYRGKATANTKFDEATAQLIEFKARDALSEITSVSEENSKRWQTYFVPIDSTSTYIDGISVSPMLEGNPPEKFGAGDQGYPLCHFVDYLLKHKKSLTFGELLTAYGEAGGFTPTLKKAFDMDEVELTKQYRNFIKANQIIFYKLAARWYQNPGTESSWALSRKGTVQGEHAVIKNQAYQTTVRRIYPVRPPQGRQQQVSVLLAYDENYKELTDFELIPIGNKDYTITRSGIMYKPAAYETIGKNTYTLEIDGGANTKSVTSGYTVWTMFAPKPIGEVIVKDGMINFTLPEKSEVAEKGYIDGYRVTITCGEKKTEKFYKISGAGKEISLKAENYKDKDTKLEEAAFHVSVCEYIKDKDKQKTFGPESDPSNSILDTMNDTLERMGAGKGKINFSLGWQSDDDLDLHVITPNGNEIYYSNRSADGGVLDVDMQVSEIVSNPAEHIDFANPKPGKYSVSVVNYTDRTKDSDSPFVVVVEVEGKKKVFNKKAGSGRTQVYEFEYGTPDPSEKGNEHIDKD